MNILKTIFNKLSFGKLLATIKKTKETLVNVLSNESKYPQRGDKIKERKIDKLFVNDKGYQVELKQTSFDMPPIKKGERYIEVHLLKGVNIENKIQILQQCKQLLSEHHKDKNIRYVLSDSWLNDEEFLNYFHNYYREKTGKESRIWKVLQETKKYVADNGGELQLTPIHPKKYEEKKAKRIRPNTFLAQALEAYEKEGHKLQEGRMVLDLEKLE